MRRSTNFSAANLILVQTLSTSLPQSTHQHLFHSISVAVPARLSYFLYFLLSVCLSACLSVSLFLYQFRLISVTPYQSIFLCFCFSHLLQCHCRHLLLRFVSLSSHFFYRHTRLKLLKTRPYTRLS